MRRANGAGPRHHLAHSMLVYPGELERLDIKRSKIIAEVSPFNIHKTRVLKTVLRGHTVYEGK